MKIDDQIKKLERISRMLREAETVIENIEGTASEIEYSTSCGSSAEPHILIEAHRLLRGCPEFCSCAVCRTTDDSLWRHIEIRYNCSLEDKREITDRHAKALDRLRKALEKEGSHVS